jgi:hypothetical protein
LLLCAPEALCANSPGGCTHPLYRKERKFAAHLVSLRTANTCLMVRKRAPTQPEVLGQRVGTVPQVHIVGVFKFRKQTFDCTECALAIMAPLVLIAELVGPV